MPCLSAKIGKRPYFLGGKFRANSRKGSVPNVQALRFKTFCRKSVPVMNYPQQAAGYRSVSCKRFRFRHLQMFYRGPDPDSPGFPLKTCGNDGLRIGDLFDAASYREW